VGVEVSAKWLVPTLFLLGTFLFLPGKIFAEGFSQIGFPNNNIYVVSADFFNKDHVIAAIRYSSTGITSGVYNSTDGGKTWVKSSSPYFACTEMKQNPKIHSEWWAACSSGIMASEDSGKSFARVSGFTYSDDHISIAKDGVIYIASANSIYKSNDGLIWEKGNLPNTSSTNAYVAVAPNNSNIAYISRTGDGAGLYKTTDGGTNWSLISTMWEFRNGVVGFFILNDGTLCADSLTEGLSFSTNGGFSWTIFSSPDPSIKNESGRLYNSSQNYDDPNNIIVTNVSQAGNVNPRIYSTEGTDSSKTKTYLLPSAFGGVSISQGIVFVSSYSLCGVWSSEGIATKPEYLTKYPIIIVPGLLGSWEVPGKGWQLDPVFHTYDGLILNLENAGYEEGKTLFAFPYQWRNDNKDAAGLLKQKIDEVKAESGSPKVDIIAHSMGGIVTRIYLEGDDYDNDVDKVFFLGTPQLGSVDSYFLWEGADTRYDGIYTSVLLDYLIKEESEAKGYYLAQDRIKYIQGFITSIGELLPTFNYKSGTMPDNKLLNELNQGSSQIGLRDVKVVNVVSDNQNRTVSWVSTVQSSEPSIWVDGEPLGLTTDNIWNGITLDHGDNTVTLNSALAIPGVNYTLSSVSHQEIPNDIGTIDAIYKELGLDKQPLVTDTINKYLMVKAYSPVTFYVESPSGERLGYSGPDSNFDEIKGGFYSGSDSTAQFAMIPNPENGEYKIVTTGNKIGNYKIESTLIDNSNDKESTQSYIGITSEGSLQTIDSEIDTGSMNVSEKIDDNIPPVSSLSVEGGTKDYYSDNVKASLNSADDISGVKEIDYSYDGLDWKKYDNPFVLSNEGKTKIWYRATDYAGNTENVKEADFVIDRTTPVVSLSINKGSFIKWESLIFKCSATDPYSGVSDIDVFIDGSPIKCEDQLFSLKSFSLGTHTISYKAIDGAGNVTLGNVKFNVVTTYESSLLDLASLFSLHHLTRLSYMQYSLWLSLANIENRLHLMNLRNSMLNLVLKQLESDKNLKKIDEIAYNLIKEDVLWLRKY
jgi:pimeloyl-ACP methyl ester carboxylesterase